MCLLLATTWSFLHLCSALGVYCEPVWSCMRVVEMVQIWLLYCTYVEGTGLSQCIVPPHLWQICHTPDKTLALDDDVTQYMQQGLLRPMVYSSKEVLSSVCPFASIWIASVQICFHLDLFHPSHPHRQSMPLAVTQISHLAQPVALITARERGNVVEVMDIGS